MSDAETTVDPTVPDKPIVVSASTLPAVAQSVGAALVIIAGAMPSFVAVLGTHDVIKMVAYAGSSSFVPVLGALGLIGTVALRTWQGVKKHTNVVTLLRQVSNRIGYVKGDPGTPGSAILVAPVKS